MRVALDAALDRFQAEREQTARRERAKQRDAESSLSNPRSTAKDYNAHAALTSLAKRAMSPWVKVAFTVSRRRAEPIGTVGGRIA